MNMIDNKTLDLIYKLIDEGKFKFAFDAEVDIMKQGYNWSKDFILKCMRNGKIYKGNELYPDQKQRHDRYYCIHKHSIISSNLIIIGFLILENLLIIHISPLNKSSREGKIYYSS